MQTIEDPATLYAQDAKDLQAQIQSYSMMKRRLIGLTNQERKEYLWSIGFSIEQAEDYLNWMFTREKKVCTTGTNNY